MTFQHNHGNSVSYDECTYGVANFQFRGPECDLSKPHMAYFGGSLTFGRYVKEPFCRQIALATAYGALNLGVVNAGVDCVVCSDTLIPLCQGAVMCVIELTGAAGVSNPYYSVHPRRNDRVVALHPKLHQAFPGLNSRDIHFVRHLLLELQLQNPQAFLDVVATLRKVWVIRMQAFLGQLSMPVPLIWVRPSDDQDEAGVNPLAADPLFLTENMVQQVCDNPDGLHVFRSEIPAQSFSLPHHHYHRHHQAVHNKIADVLTKIAKKPAAND